MAHFVETHNVSLLVPDKEPAGSFLWFRAHPTWSDSLRAVLRRGEGGGQQQNAPALDELIPYSAAGGTPATFDSLISSMTERANPILYLGCDLANVDGRVVLLLESDGGRSGSAELVTVDRFISKVLDLSRPPRLILLHVLSNTRPLEYGSTYAAMAQASRRFVAAGIPAVIMIPGGVPSDSHLFKQLAVEIKRGLPIDRAFAEARRQALTENRSDSHERAAIQASALFTCLRSGQIWPLRATIPSKECADLGVVPLVVFVGPQCGTPKRTFWPELVRRWASLIGYPLSRSPGHDLAKVARFASPKAVNEKPAVLIDLLTLWARQLEIGPKPTSQEATSDPLRELGLHVCNKLVASSPDLWANLAKLNAKIYYTTDPTDGLYKELDNRGRNPLRIIGGMADSWWDDPTVVQRLLESNQQRTLVIHYLGHLHDPKTLVLTEDDFLELLLSMENRLHGCKDLISNYSKDKRVLFLGFDLQDWEFQIALRGLAMRNNVLRQFASMSEQRIKMQSGNHPLVAVQLTPHEDEIWQPDVALKYLQRYLRKSHAQVYWCDSAEFLRQIIPAQTPDDTEAPASSQ